MENFNNPEFITERLFMNRINISDQANIYKGLSTPEVIKHYGVQYSSFEETQEQMNWYANLEKSNSGKWWAIRWKNTGEFCGAIGFNDYHPEYKKAEIGFWLLPINWGKGIVKEAAERIIQYLFDELCFHRLEAYVEAGNSNSTKVLKKVGFNFEGRMRECEIKNGKYISIDLYALLNENSISVK